jgi:hypothetical protein
VYGWDGDPEKRPPPFWEDDVDLVVTPGLTLLGKTRCARCIVTTINQQTLQRSREPLLTLREFRRGAEGNKVYFGRNFYNLGSGSIRVGEPLYSHFTEFANGWAIASREELDEIQLEFLGKVSVSQQGRLYVFNGPYVGRLALEASLVDSPVAGEVNELWFSHLLSLGQSGYRLVRR